MQKILLADEHPIVRHAIKNLLQAAFDCVQISEAIHAEDLLRMIMRENWDLLVADIEWNDRDGIYLLKDIKNLAPALPVLVVSGYPEDLYAIQVIEAGGAGYLQKNTGLNNLSNAITALLQGDKWMRP